MNEVKKIYLKDYKEPRYQVPNVDLVFNIEDSKTIVSAKLIINRNEKDSNKKEPFLFYGDKDVRLLKIFIDEKELTTEEYKIQDSNMLLFTEKDNFILQTEVEIDPSQNKSCSGLYKSNNLYCTQMEPEDFRKVTYYPDRPDVLSKFTTTIIADKDKYPTLLSNGNLISEKITEDGKKEVVWSDPFPKPCYLFALVAGDLGVICDSFKTKSGRDVLLEIYCDKGNEDKCWHAMDSLKRSMKWDEDRFNLEYDLDRFMMAITDDFNAGAMENKGLNIFNSSCVLVSPETATDDNYFFVERIVAHEYFHNWTGNRVTCRDWFQLTLKEGLTVLRDQEFSSDYHTRSVQRIDDVSFLRTVQFDEDAGPNAHPIRSESFTDISNFYTATVYEKGSEVIRMILSMYGEEAFQAGIVKYFELFDGQAITTEDFLHAMEEGVGKELKQFRNWYSQAGTPIVKVETNYNEGDGKYELKLSQTCPDTPNQTNKKPFVIPLAVALLDNLGREIDFECEDVNAKTSILELSEKEEIFIFKNVPEKPILSINRNFTAPVIIEQSLSLSERIEHLRLENDPVNKYIAGQVLLTEELVRLVKAGSTAELSQEILSAYGSSLYQENISTALKARLIEPIPVSSLVSDLKIINYESAQKVYNLFCRKFALKHYEKMLEIYNLFNKELNSEYKWLKEDVSKRNLKNKVLFFLVHSGSSEAVNLAFKQYQNSNNMTDAIKALECLALKNCEQFNNASKDFYDKWKNNDLVMLKWFRIIALRDKSDVLSDIEETSKLTCFIPSRPNHIRALYAKFTVNHTHFHHISGKGYKFIADKMITIADFNPDLSASFAKQFSKYPKMDKKRQSLIKKELKRVKSEIKDMKNSLRVIEIINNTINSV